MKVELRAVGKVQMVTLHGKLVLGETDGLRDAVRSLLTDNQKRIILDLRKVPYMDSAGIGEVAACRKRAKDVDAIIGLLKDENQYSLSVEFILGLTFPGNLHSDEKAALGSF